MANMDLLSYERDSRWMPHLSWTYPDWTHQEKMAQQAAQREMAWQRIADKLGPLLIGSDVTGVLHGGGGSLGQSDYIDRDILDQDHEERAYEKAPLLNTNIRPYKQLSGKQTRLEINNTRNGYQSLNSNNNNNNQQGSDPRILDSIDSLIPCKSPLFSEKRSQSSGIDINYLEHHHQQQQQLYQQQQLTKHQHKSKYLNQVHQHQQYYQNYNTSNHNRQQQYDSESYMKARRRCWTVSGILIFLVLILFTLVTLMAFGVIQYKTFRRIPS